METMKCPGCGKIIKTGVLVCPYCGEKIDNTQSTEKEKSEMKEVTHNLNAGNTNRKIRKKWIALLLCWLLGTIGIHRVYADNDKSAPVYFLTHLFGFFGIFAIMDFFKILFTYPKEWYV